MFFRQGAIHILRHIEGGEGGVRQIWRNKNLILDILVTWKRKMMTEQRTTGEKIL